MASPARAGRDPELAEALATYLQTDSAERRRELTVAIAKLAGDSASKVAEELSRLQLWEPLAGSGFFELPLGAGGTAKMHWRLPTDYDPAGPYPALLSVRRALADLPPLHAMTAGLAADLDRFVLIQIEGPLGERVGRKAGAADDFRTIVREIRKRIRIEFDRLFLFGAGQDADVAWMIALNHAEMFAGAILIDGYPQLPYPAETYAFWLENVTNVPILSAWRDLTFTGPARTRPERVAVHNRAIATIADALSLPVTAVPVAAGLGEDPDIVIGQDAAGESLEARRTVATRIARWARFADQRDAGWLSLAEFRGEVWDDEQIHILPAATTDRTEFVQRVIQGKLAYIGGTVENNVLTLSTRRAARITVQLSTAIVDLDLPVRIVCNGVRRFDGPVRPSIETMLETAYETWDLQHPVWAEVSFAVQSDAEDVAWP